MYDNENGVEKKQTESQRILDSFDYELDELDKIASTIVNKVTSLGGFKPSKCEACDAQKPPQGSHFINDLDVRLGKLQRLVEAYDAIRYNLEKLV